MSSVSDTSKLAFLGQKWKFVKETPTKKPGKHKKNESILKAIEEIERRTVDDRILDLQEAELKQLLKNQAAFRSDSPVTMRNEAKPSQFFSGAYSQFENAQSPSKAYGDKELINCYDARELAVSLNTIRIFYAQKNNDMGQAFKPSLVVDKVQDSPRAKDKVVRKPENNLIYENGTIIENKQFNTPTISIPPAITVSNIRGSLSVATNVNYSGSFSSPYAPGTPANGTSTRRAASRRNKLRQSYNINFNDGNFNKVILFCYHACMVDLL